MPLIVVFRLRIKAQKEFILKIFINHQLESVLIPLVPIIFEQSYKNILKNFCLIFNIIIHFRTLQQWHYIDWLIEMSIHLKQVTFSGQLLLVIAPYMKPTKLFSQEKLGSPVPKLKTWHGDFLQQLGNSANSGQWSLIHQPLSTITIVIVLT